MSTSSGLLPRQATVIEHYFTTPDTPGASAGLAELMNKAPASLSDAELREVIEAERERAALARGAKKQEAITLLAEEHERQLLAKMPEALTLAQLLAADYPEPRWAADGVVPEGHTVLGGAPKAGKSWLTMGLALAVSCGGLFLGEIPVVKRRVLLLALEDSERRLKERFKQLRAEPNEDLIVRTRWSWGLAGLKAEVKRTGAEVVIIDTLQKWRGYDGSPDSYAKDYDTVGELQTFAMDHRLNLIVNHHTRKAPHDDPLATVSGTFGLTGAADTILVLRRAQAFEGAELIVRGRDVEPQELALRFDQHTGWHLIGDAKVIRLSDERQAIIEVVREAGEPVGPRAIGEELGRDDPGLRQMLRRMVRDGDLERERRGRYIIPPEKAVTSVTKSQEGQL